MRVGFAGLGRMGRPMALNLVRAGHEVIVWNRNLERARAFAGETGATTAATPRELAENTEIVVTMLADDQASENVHHGTSGLFAAIGGAGMLVEMGIMSPWAHHCPRRSCTARRQNNRCTCLRRDACSSRSETDDNGRSRSGDGGAGGTTLCGDGQGNGMTTRQDVKISRVTGQFED